MVLDKNRRQGCLGKEVKIFEIEVLYLLIMVYWGRLFPSQVLPQLNLSSFSPSYLTLALA